MRIQIGTARRQLNRFYTTSLQRFPEKRAELRVAIMQCVSTLIQESPCLPGRIPCHLLHSRLVWVPRNPSQADATALQVNEEQYVVGRQTTPSEDLYREEVDHSQHGQMRFNEFLPRRVLTGAVGHQKSTWPRNEHLPNNGAIRYRIGGQ